MLYLVPLPETRLSRRGRVQGSGRVTLDKQGETELEIIAKTIHSVKADIPKVYASDAHAGAGRRLAAQLHTKAAITPRLRGFNIGRFTGASHQVVDSEIERLAHKEEMVPVQGGDSLMSYRRRFVDFIKKLIDKNETAVILADPREIAVIRAITQDEGFVDALLSRNHVERGKVYVVRALNQASRTADNSPARSADVGSDAANRTGDTGRA